jgi:Cof subfamily protein (haloacid dehalogenase superfamily)
MPPLKLIAVDIDGTLLNSRFQVSTEDLRALQEAHANGVHIVLATGRRHSFTLPIASRLGFEPFIISSNGAVTRDTRGSLLAKNLMKRDTARAVLDSMQQWTDQAVLTMDREGPGAMFVQSQTAVSARITRWVESNRDSISEVSPLQDALTEDPLQLMFCGELDEMQSLVRDFDATEIRSRVSCHVTQYDQRDLSILDVLPLGCTKGHALGALCERLGVNASEVLAIGDNYNDVEMLEFAGHAFVMANAHQDMKARSWKVTRSNDEDGVAHAIQSVLEPALSR